MDDQNKNVVEYGEESGANGEIKAAGKINLPNKLTIFRIILVPLYMVFILLPKENILGETWPKIFAAALFFIAAMTDLVDGLLARRLNLITDFGKLMDPLADKFMVMGAMIAITASDAFAPVRWLAVWATTIVFFREFAVTSIRLLASTSGGTVIAANFAGKLKTILQIACVLTILLEDTVITHNLGTPPCLFCYVTMAVMIAATVYSGFVYFKNYWKHINPAK
ncbi:MAG: CDP-diacylglycerol--glycerol-3-phosphate 3-phosphatidyltransferase [Oscillospiraceae bacterium]|nr:CDP-diacylglycerol--glycerol-3-phosphate 3-phosphatidyltransferase [Oscillospiraceae bacterium]